MKLDLSYWNNKRVLITGHTGFKGGWLSTILHTLNSKVAGLSLAPSTEPNLFTANEINNFLDASYITDIRNIQDFSIKIQEFKPQIIFHLAAQAIVSDSYEDPIKTYQTNVMGTANLLESIRHCPSVETCIIVTSDKCYENKEWIWGYRENDPMGGDDPYSNSKGCTELVTHSFRKSFFSSHNVKIATCRAGNVIGGGDWSNNRIIPDAIRAFVENNELILRRPHAIRPWQHVIDPLLGYMLLAEKLDSSNENAARFCKGWNFGPNHESHINVENLISKFTSYWGDNAKYTIDLQSKFPKESNTLKLDITQTSHELGYRPMLNIEECIKKTVDWYKAFYQKGKSLDITINQINDVLGRVNK